MSFWHIALKDVQVMLRDKKALLILVAMPVILTTILGLALGPLFNGPSPGVPHLSIAIVKQPPAAAPPLWDLLTEEQQEQINRAAGKLDLEEIFLQDFLASNELQKMLDYRIMAEPEAREMLAQQKIDAIVYLPDNFSTQYVMGKNINLRVVTNTGSAAGTVLEGILQSFTDTLSLPRIAMQVIQEEKIAEGIAAGPFPDAPASLTSLVENSHTSVTINTVAEEGKKVISARQYYAAAMAVMFILFAAGFGAAGILQERDSRTFDRLVVAGQPKSAVVAGKFTATMLIALLQMSVMFTFTHLVFGVDWGTDPAGLASVTFSAVFAVAGLGILIACLVKTERGIIVFQSVVVQVMAFLGGSFLPVYAMPEFLNTLAAFTINGQALKAYLSLMEGATLGDITATVVYLTGFGITSLGIGAKFLKITG
jgi:ABC-2 type transport system permease protein